MKYGRGWSEPARLKDGREVLLRCVRPQDKELLARGFQELSPRSRFRRFLTAKPHLTRRELRYFTEVDFADHVAIGAVCEAEDAPDGEQGLGIGRFVRLPEKPDTAEAAVAVIDAMHHRGVGSLILQHLAAAACERDIGWFRNVLFADNEPALGLLHHMSEDLKVVSRDGSTLVVDLPLRAPTGSDTWEDTLHSIQTVFRLAAKRLIHVLSGWHTMGQPPPGA